MLATRDRHSVAGTWSLPFAFVLAFTGSFFSFYGTVGLPVVATAAFSGDVEALQHAVFGNPGTPDPRPAASGNLDRITSDAIRRTGEVPTFVAIENFGRSDATVTSYHNPREGDLEPVALLYNGATAEFIRAKPQVGAGPSAGGTLVGIIGPLHFGNFAGLLSKAIWFGLGFAMCYVTYTGMRLWVVRRREDARSLAWLERTLTVVAFGLPLGLVVAAAGFLVTMPQGGAVYWTTTAFLIASAVAIIAGVVAHSNDALTLMLKGATGLVMLMLPLLRLVAAGGPGWTAAIASGQAVIPALDLAFVVAGGWLLRGCWHARPLTLPERPRRMEAVGGAMNQLAPLPLAGPILPALIAAADERAQRRFLEFFAAAIRNPHTRRAYARAASDFLAWIAARGVASLGNVQPLHVAAWIEALAGELAAPSVKQQLAGVRHLFDWLVTGQVVPVNPAASVRGPAHSQRRGKTPVLAPDEARALLDKIDVTGQAGLRDRALIALMVYSFARIGAALAMKVEDVFVQNRRLWVRLHEKGGKRHEMPCHHNLEHYLIEYIDGCGLREDRKGPLFRTIARGTKRLSDTPLPQANAFAMVRRRAAAAGIGTAIGNHSFRATGITTYLKNGGTLETAATMANHSSTRTTQLYDRRPDDVTLDEVERVLI